MKFLPVFAALLCAALKVSAADSIVVFNEIQYHPAAGQPEFIELRNLNGVDVNVGGWRIDGGVDFTIPAGTIMPGGGYLVIGAVPGAIGSFTGTLNNSGETLRLRNLNSRIMDEVTYKSANDWPLGADGSGAALARRSAGAQSGAVAWVASTQLGGTPGLKNFGEATDFPTVTALVAMNAAWKYRDDNVAQAAGWTGPLFDDSAWLSGGALLFAGSPNVTGAGEGLYGYWPLSETAGTVAPNLAAGGTAGSLFPGATWAADGTRGQVLVLDGVDGYVDAGTVPVMTLANNFTWSFWAYSTQTGGNVVVGNRYSSTTGTDFSPREFMKFTPSTLQYDHNAVENIDYTDMPLSTWVHHAMVKSGATYTYYRNGVAGGSLTTAVGQNYAHPFYFGGDKTNENWSGKLDDIAVWTKALPATAIASLAAGTVTPLTAPTGSSGGVLTTPLALGPVTHYFRKTFTFSGAKERTTLTLTHLLDDGAVFYLNGTEVLRVNMPVGAVAHGTTASVNITSTALSSAVTIPTAALVSGANVLAVEVHQFAASAPNNDMVFGATLTASETAALPPLPSLVFSEIAGANDASFFIELRNTTGAALDTTGWVIKADSGQTAAVPAQNVAAGGYVVVNAAALGFTPLNGAKLFLLAPGGTELREARDVTNRDRGLLADGRWGHPDVASPGAANVATISSAVVINEIFYHAPGVSPEQWIELHNKSAAAVDISLWKLSDGVSYGFPAGTVIPAGGFLVVAWDPAAFAVLHPGVTALGPWSGSLSGHGELLTLRDANDNVANQLTYYDAGRWSSWADGSASSLELKDPNADNSRAEAWDSSDESSHSTWQNVTYNGLGANPTFTSNDATNYNEFVMGLLSGGECLVDDISVLDKGTTNTGGTELMQNGTFNGGTTAAWRIIGTQRGSVVADGGGNVLKLTATSGTEHMSNHAETTLKNGASYVALDATHYYTISFRAKWLRGSNRLHTRLWFNRLAQQTLLNMPATGGTPGAVNSRRVANLGPTFDALAHTPVVPAAGATATVSVKVADNDGLASVLLFTSVNGAAFTSSAMSTTGGGLYSGTVAGQSAGALVQFYVQATDGLGAVTFFPAGGSASRAIIPWDDGKAALTLASGAHPHNLRVVMTGADATDFYKLENVMSNDFRPCTVIWDEREVYYRPGVRLKSSEHGRFDGNRVGYVIDFGDDELFLGANGTIAVDRSGGTSAGQKEILIKTTSNAAGGIYAMEDDIIRIIAPVATGTGAAFTGVTVTGAALLSKARFDKEYLDGQWTNGGSGPLFKYDLCYILTQTIDTSTRVVTAWSAGNILTSFAENPKVPQSGGEHPGVNVTSLGTNKEVYRWHWLIKNAHGDDDYSGVLNMTTAMDQVAGSAAFKTQTAQYMDVNGWLRAAVPANLFGVTDNYLGVGTSQHNTLVFFPPGGKATLIPWDLDFLSQSNSSSSLTTGGDITKFIADPVNGRLYYGHMLDILNRSFNTAFLTRWATHYTTFGTDDMTTSLTFLNARASYARTLLEGASSPIPFTVFARTSSNNVTVATPFATVSGVGWINVAEIRLQGSAQELAVTWTGSNTWTLQLPIAAGTRTYTLVPYDNNGVQLGNTASGGTPVTTSVTITGSGGIFPAGPGNLTVSELHYNPAGAQTTEFVELLNITSATLDLSGCHFDEELGQGIAYTFANGVQVPPGGRVIVARNRTAFVAAYPAASPVAAGQYDPSGLDNGGESLVLYAASGLEIFRFTYTDSIAATDGGGKSLVRVLSSTNPDVNTAVWRASLANGGNPGGTDSVAFSGAPLADADGDGLPALLEYALGTSDAAATTPPWSTVREVSGDVLLTFPRVLNADDAVLTIEAVATPTGAWAPATAALVTSTTAGNIATETWRITVPPGSPAYFVRLKATPR